MGAGETPVIPNVFILSLSSAVKLGLIIPKGSYCNFFLVSLCCPNDQGFVIEQHRGEIMKEVGQKKMKERKKEKRTLYQLTKSVKLRIL
jgi:hypothetical protein